MGRRRTAFYYDALRLPDGTRVPLKIHSMVGLLPVLPGVTVPRAAAELGALLGKHFARFLADIGHDARTSCGRAAHWSSPRTASAWS